MMQLARTEDDKSRGEAENIARTLLLYAELPINIRVQCHVVLCKLL